MAGSALSIVFVSFLMMTLGFFCQRYGWLGANAQTILARLTLRIAMPGLVISNILGYYDRAMLLRSAFYLLAPLAVFTFLYLFSGALAAWIHIPQGRRGVFRAMFTFGNAMFLGLPVCRAIFGEASVPMVLFYYIISTLFWCVIGAPAVSRDGGITPRNPIRRLSLPPLVACLFSLLLVVIGIRPPEVLMTAAASLGGLVTPLSMLFLGSILCTMLKDELRWQKGYGWMLLGRSLLAPALCFALCLALGLPKDVLNVFIVQAGMPAQTQTCLWAQEHGADAGYAAGGIVLSTLSGLLTIPALAFALGWLV